MAKDNQGHEFKNIDAGGRMSHLAGKMGNSAVRKPKGESQTEEVAGTTLLPSRCKRGLPTGGAPTRKPDRKFHNR